MRHMTSLSYIDTVAKVGSIRAAAELLSITASALNRRILAIESELGVALFERHAGGVALNSAGELFVHHIRAQKADLERVRSRIADLQGNRRGHVRIAAPRALAQSLLAAEIARYQADFPLVTFKVLSCAGAEGAQALSDLEVDILLSLDYMEQLEHQLVALAPAPIYCLMRRDHPLAAGATLGIAECRQYPLLLPARGDPVRERIEISLARKNLTSAARVESNDPQALSALAARGVGVAFVAQPLAAETPDMALAALNQNDVQPLALTLTQRRRSALPVAAGKFAERLRAALAGG